MARRRAGKVGAGRRRSIFINGEGGGGDDNEDEKEEEKEANHRGSAIRRL